MIKTLPFSELSKINNDVYKSVVVIGKRTKQVINDRQIERANVIHEEEDYESLDSVHEIENSDYVEKDKVIVTSLNEYLNNEIEVVEEQSQDI
ncbi:MAG: hypothetical protein VX770_00590 [Candidatus Neomarinimicrobiota bacterium]|jgi:hypothetical protein|nr:hypothetical protein [Candidatus Neomarinimicrobiota bacterium]|tara:strand:+ start:1607 stop:1885 length:279 start_codon:yes stop_codon:yes gene_type:complete